MNSPILACPFCGAGNPVPPPVAATTCANCSRLIHAVPQTSARMFPGRLRPMDLQRLEPFDALELLRPRTFPASFASGRLKHHINGRHVGCFACSRTFHVPPHATVATCPHCHNEVSLADVHIHTQHASSVRTLGAATIHRGAAFVGPSINCSDLVVEGTLSGAATCTHTLAIRASGTVSGAINCDHLVVERGTTVRFLNHVRTRTAEVHGSVEAEINCAGSAVVSRHGSLAGSVIAGDLQVDPGGTVLAETTIRRGQG